MFGIRAHKLKCEYGSNPLGIDVPKPRLSWQIECERRGVTQSAYQILAASSEELLASDKGDLWDSGKVISNQSVHVLYNGKALVSSQKVFWKVRVWDENDIETSWSDKFSWTMGILSISDWNAYWIGSSEKNVFETMLLRKEFEVRPALRRAVVYVCGLGQYEFFLNGQKVGEDLLSPGWTKYDKTCLYDTYDVTDMLCEDTTNAVGIFLGNGMYNVQGGRYAKFKGSFGPLKVIAQLRLEYEDGSFELVTTDKSWRISHAPITFSCVYGGEDYDARLEQYGWNEPAFNDAKWKAASVLAAPGGKLRGHSSGAPSFRAIDTLKVKKKKEISPTISVYDFGQNISLMPRIFVRGPRGSVVKITPAELLHDNGRVDRGSVTQGSGSPAYWSYVLGGEEEETYFPKFFYHGARYLEVEVASPAGNPFPIVESIEAVIVHSSAAPVGYFNSSSTLFNRIHEFIRWAQRSNLMHVITDCPHRERLGWLEQYHLNGPSLRYEFDLAQLFAKGMTDMADSQFENGLIPDIAPEYVVFGGGFRDSPEWGSAYVIVPWQQYEWTGDIELLRRHYDGMKRYVAYLTSRSEKYIVSHGLGDWYDIGPNSPGQSQLTPTALTATAFYYMDAAILSAVAYLLELDADVEYFMSLSSEIRVAFNKKFYNTKTGNYATGSQCANSIALVMDLVEEKNRSKVLDSIVKDVRKRGNALTAGDVGYRYLLRALADGGRSDVIFDMNNQSDKPGYGYQLKHGATSLTEAWDTNRGASQNHFMLGHIIEWFFHDLAGLASDPDKPGFKNIIIKPNIVGDIMWASASYESMYGTILSAWFITGDTLHMHVNVPPNTTATVFIPSLPERVTESNKSPVEDRNIRYIGYENDRSIYAVGSGQYHFEISLKIEQKPIPA